MQIEHIDSTKGGENNRKVILSHEVKTEGTQMVLGMEKGMFQIIFALPKSAGIIYRLRKY